MSIARKKSQRAAKASGAKQKIFDFGTVSEPQAKFLASKTFFTCYGGAKGGGKSHIARLKAVGLCLNYPGIRVLMIRCHYPELEENLIRPILKWVPQELFAYNSTVHLMKFSNGSEIKFGHYDGDAAENEYQGVEYDVIFIDEATQLTERNFSYLQGCIRGINNFPKRMYLTCNPGGVGHRWVKRLFIDRQYITDEKNPEKNENPEDYTFIPATVDDNPWLLKASPMYKKQLSQMPEDQVKAFRYGDWNALSGSYFKNFSIATHTVEAFPIPAHWPRYRSFDYGFDLFACGWWAVDEDGRSWCYRYFEQKGLVIKDAAKQIIDHTPPNERIQITYAPPDMWARSKDTGREIAEIFTESGVPLVKSNNNRVQGHMVMKNAMTPMELHDPYVKALYAEGAPDKLPMLMFFREETLACIDDICDIQADEKKPEDCAKQPHDVTHSVDMVRYYIINRVIEAEAEKQQAEFFDEDEEQEQGYEEYMCGGDTDATYMDY